MPHVTQHRPGTFCWPELATPDPAAATSFYARLLGWTVRESPADQGVYYMLHLGEPVVGGMFRISEAMTAEGVPPHWGAYVSVPDTEDAVAKAVAAGGTLKLGPFDVGTAGRMAILQDPLGAVFNVWQARNHPGTERVNEPGALGWMQLNARDPEAAKAFYPALFGWTVQDTPMGGGVTYTTWLREDGPAGGMMPMPPGTPATAPSHWLAYFCVASVAESHAKAVSLGAKSFVAPTEIPGGGTFAVLADPQGAIFGIMTAT